MAVRNNGDEADVDNESRLPVRNARFGWNRLSLGRNVAISGLQTTQPSVGVLFRLHSHVGPHRA